MAKLKSNFSPMGPRDPHVINIFTGEFTTEILSHIVAAQWRADKKQGRDTLVVMGSDLEVALLNKDLETEGIEDEDIMITLPDEDDGRDGKLFIYSPKMVMQYFLHEFDCALHGEGPPTSIGAINMTVMVNLGWGNVKAKMGIVLMALTRLAQRQQSKEGRLLLCAIRDGEAAVSVAGDQTLQVLSEAGRALSRPKISWHDLTAIKETFASLSGRCVVLAGRLSLSLDLGKTVQEVSEAFDGFSSLADPSTADVRCELQPEPCEIKSLLVHEDVAYVGPVHGLEAILVHPHKLTWIHDPYSCHNVLVKKLPRSKAEIRHVINIRAEGEAVPEVHCFLKEAQFDKLEEGGLSSSPCHHIELEKLLLAGQVLWNGLMLRVFELPQRRLVEQHLRRLRNCGLLERRPLATRPTYELSESPFDGWKMTNLGRIACETVMFSTIESMSTIHLLAQLRLQGSAVEPSPAVSDALLSLAAILSTTEHMTSIQRVVFRVEESYMETSDVDFQDYIDNELCGFAASLIWRGPIWFCVAIWHTLRYREDWRAYKDVEDMREGHYKPWARRLKVFQGSVIIDRLTSFQWDSRLPNLIVSADSKLDATLIGSNDHVLSSEELALVDQALVRAFVDKLVFVVGVKPDGEAFAHDLASQREMQEPDEVSRRLLYHEKCLEMEREALGREVGGYFCIYTHLEREPVEFSASGILEEFEWRPINLTYVPSTAVFAVLKEIPAAHPEQSLIARTIFHV